MVLPQNTYELSYKVKYTLRAIMNFIGFEIWIHLSHSFALSTIPENERFWENFSSSELLLLGQPYINYKFIILTIGYLLL